MQVSLSSGWGCFHAPFWGSPGWCSFSKAQLAGLQAVPACRVLLETDAPYFQFPGHRHSFPGLIEMCAGVVALALGVSWESLLERSVANARALYDGGD